MSSISCLHATRSVRVTASQSLCAQPLWLRREGQPALGSVCAGSWGAGEGAWGPAQQAAASPSPAPAPISGARGSRRNIPSLCRAGLARGAAAGAAAGCGGRAGKRT